MDYQAIAYVVGVGLYVLVAIGFVQFALVYVFTATIKNKLPDNERAQRLAELLIPSVLYFVVLGLPAIYILVKGASNAYYP